MKLKQGWINAFCFWDGQAKKYRGSNDPLPEQGTFLELDGVSYHRIDLPAYPSAQVSVPVTLTGFGNPHARMVAGIVGMRTSSSGTLSLIPMEKKTILGTPPTKTAFKPGFWKRFSRFSKGVSQRQLHTAVKTQLPPQDQYVFQESEGKDKLLDTLSPESGWWIFASMSEKEIAAKPPEESCYDRPWYFT